MTPPLTGPLARVNVRADAWDLIWSFVHRTLVINLGLAIGGVPLFFALATVAQPWRYPVFFAVLAVPLGPSVAAAFAYLAGEDPSLPVLFRAYRVLAVRAVLLWAAVVGLIGILVADIRLLYDAMPGAAVVPLLAVLVVLTLATGLALLVLSATKPELPLRAALRLAVYAAVRTWALSVLSLVVLVAAVVIVSQVPPAGLATVPGCALWVVFTNTKLQLSRVLPEESQ
ncbi:putative membrane protein YesL [Kribbella sp. VKM Ac-2527]|uniref:Putative membrane protein YesL n=1 Tax=Kribbella caucasensis TaxID=2512215 RepID=A0A4R6KLZ3_9ACTN|nr:hypothetical protein [Kribbella sp. VKM Ac-2527]TDO51405.1 putative membrane protein YesL [Kribbella sp. VKM Ac-2527]